MAQVTGLGIRGENRLDSAGGFIRGLPSAFTYCNFFGSNAPDTRNLIKGGPAPSLVTVAPGTPPDGSTAAGTVMRNSRSVQFGMVEGWFTGKMFADYFGGGRYDPVGARRIIRGTVWEARRGVARGRALGDP